MRAISCSMLMLALSACAAPGGPYPSLEPRAGEAVDPRVAVDRPLNDRPVSAALSNRLAALVAQAHEGDAAFNAAMDQAERLAAAAAPPQSEGWIAAQEALTTAIAAAAPTHVALGDIDGLGATALETQGGISPNDLAAIKRAGAEVGAIDQRQADRIRSLQRRLGL